MIITLLSNANMKDYPENTCNDFRNKIPRLRTMMEGGDSINFSVAPLDLFHPTEFENVGVGNFVHIFAKNQLQNPVKTVTMSPGMYNSIWPIIEFLNDNLQVGVTREKNKKNTFTFGYNQSLKRTTIIFAKKDLYCLKFSNDMAGILGFDSNRLYCYNDTLIDNKMTSPYTASWYGMARDQIMIYLDCVEQSLIGNHYSNLLTIVNWDHNSVAGSTHIKFDSPRFVKIENGNIDNIRVKLTTLSGKPIPFFDGNVILTLEIRSNK